MARVGKKPQYEAFNHRPNCFGVHQKHNRRLQDWRDPRRPLLLEVGAGQAQISIGFSCQKPSWQVLALDKKSDRLHKAAKSLDSLENIAFLQTDLAECLSFLDLRGQVSLLWLAFPDPYPKKRQAKHRLTHPDKIDFYGQLLLPGGLIRLKTDSQPLFDYSLEVFQQHPDFLISKSFEDLQLVESRLLSFDALIMTHYEKKFLKEKRTIHYLEAAFQAAIKSQTSQD